MVEVKLLTKVGRPEQAIITLQNRFYQHKLIEDENFNKQFPFSAQLQNSQIVSKSLFLNSLWCLYKGLKYELKLAVFTLDHFGQGPHRPRIEEPSSHRHIDRAILKLTNKLHQLNFLIEANQQKKKDNLHLPDFDMFEWLFLKTLFQLRFNHTHIFDLAMAQKGLFA